MSASIPLIPRRTLFGNPDRAGIRISPDGTRVSFLAPVDGVLNVWVGPADDLAAAKPVTHDAKRGIRVYFWAWTSEEILYLQDKDGDENWHLHLVRLVTGEEVDLTPIDGVRAEVQGISHRTPDEVLVGLNDRDPHYHDLYRLDLRTGERTLAFRNERFVGFTCDDDYRLRLATVFTERAEVEVWRFDGEEAVLDSTIGAEDAMTTDPIGTDASGDVVYLLDSRGRDTSALYTWNLANGDRALVGEDARADIQAVMVHPTGGHLEAYQVDYDKPEWVVVDPEVAEDFRLLGEAIDGVFRVASRNRADDRWVIAAGTDTGPVSFHIWDRTTKAARFLGVSQEKLLGLPLSPMHPVVIPARDGLSLVSYLTLPAGSDPEATGRPSEPGPLVLWVHGGPWARDEWGFHPVHQWLSNRGYAVLSVNYRGSTGFGKGFLNAGNREWAGKMHDDLIDACEWAVSEGIARRDAIAIGGGSYGGWATLVGVTFTPDTFACGVDIVGPSSLVTLLENVPPYWVPILPVMTERVGDHTTEEGRAFLLSRSPLTRVEEIQRPLLIGQGANDPRVKQLESDQIVSAMQAKGIPVTYALYPDEGHGFARPANRISFFAVTEAFLAPILGGRFEPIGEDLEGSTLQIPVGREHVAGLPEE